MIEILIGLGYATVGLTSAFYITRSMLRKETGGEYSSRTLDTEEYVMTSIIGLMGGALWPATLAGAGFVALMRRDHERTDPTLRKRRLDERERRIRELEQELGIGHE